MLKNPPGMEISKYPRARDKRRDKNLAANIPKVGWSKAWAEGHAGALARALDLDPSDPSVHEFADTTIGRAASEAIIYDGPTPDNVSAAKSALEKFILEQETIPDLTEPPDGQNPGY